MSCNGAGEVDAPMSKRRSQECPIAAGDLKTDLALNYFATATAHALLQQVPAKSSKNRTGA
jgi:hypothetical protein